MNCLLINKLNAKSLPSDAASVDGKRRYLDISRLRRRFNKNLLKTDQQEELLKNLKYHDKKTSSRKYLLLNNSSQEKDLAEPELKVETESSNLPTTPKTKVQEQFEELDLIEKNTNLIKNAKPLGSQRVVDPLAEKIKKFKLKNLSSKKDSIDSLTKDKHSHKKYLVSVDDLKSKIQQVSVNENNLKNKVAELYLNQDNQSLDKMFRLDLETRYLEKRRKKKRSVSSISEEDKEINSEDDKKSVNSKDSKLTYSRKTKSPRGRLLKYVHNAAV